MKNKKFEIWVIIFMVIFALIIFGFYLIYNYIVISNTFILFLKPSYILTCYKYDCKTLSLNDYNNKNYDTYINNNYIGNYRLYYDEVGDDYYMFDIMNHGSIVSAYDKMLGIQGNVSVIDFNEEEMTKDEINYIDNKLDFNLYNPTLAYKIVKDFDNDGNNETIYTISNSLEEIDYYYSVILYENDSELNVVLKEFADNEITLASLSVNSIIDVKKDSIYELIIGKSYYSEKGLDYYLYKLKDNNYIVK